MVMLAERRTTAKPVATLKTVPKTNRSGDMLVRRIMGAKLMRARVRAGLSLQDAAIRSAINAGQLKHYELGFRVPSSFQVQKLVTKAGYQPTDIYRPLSDAQVHFLRTVGPLPEDTFGPTPWKDTRDLSLA